MSQNIGTLITATIKANSSLDQIATFHSNDGLGGVHSVETLSDRDSIMSVRRQWGMFCYVVNNNTTYQLTYGFSDSNLNNNNNWSISANSIGSNSGEWLDSAISSTLTTPPTTNNVGDRYLLLNGASGDWSGNIGKIAEYRTVPAIGWDFTVPRDGTSLRVDNEDNSIYKYEGDYSTGEWHIDRSNQVISLSAASTDGMSYESNTTNMVFDNYTKDVIFLLKPSYTNTGSMTININGIGDVPVKKDVGGGPLSDLIANEFRLGITYTAVFNGNEFQILGTETSSMSLASSTPNKYYIESGETVIVPVNSQYLIYGNLTVDGVLENNGYVVIVNGYLIQGTNGLVNNNGIIEHVDLLIGPNNYTITTNITANNILMISHNLNTLDPIVSIRIGTSFYNAEVDVVDGNTISILSSSDASIRVNVKK